MWSWHQHCKTFYAGTDGLRHKLRQNFNVVGSAFFTATNSLRWTLINASNFCHNLGQNSNSYGVESFDSFDRVLFNALLTEAIFGLRQSSDHATAASVIWRICHSNCIIGAISSDYFRLIRFTIVQLFWKYRRPLCHIFHELLWPMILKTKTFVSCRLALIILVMILNRGDVVLLPR